MNEDSLNERKERLRTDLRDEAYRRQYATSTLIQNVSAQVQALRRQRGLTQEGLAGKVKTKQPRISSVETPPDGDRPPNWEVDTLDRIAQALGTRLKITFETYGSLVDELDAVTSDSLRRPEVANDPILFPKPSMPAPDPVAPERTRWMQELMIPWLWEDKLDIERLIGWLQGLGLPPVGADEEPYQWLLRGVSVPGPAQDSLEKRFAERLAVVLGEQPDVEPLVSEGQEDFLVNLYWTCAGLRQPGHLAEQLWQTYKRLKGTKPSGAVRDALQGALVQNPFGEKALKEIWQPMVERGRHRWFRGGEIVGYEGILVHHQMVRPDLEKVFWALGRISHRWKAGTAEQQAEFKRLISKIPDLLPATVKTMIEYARSAGSWAHWASDWASELLPLPVIASQDPSPEFWLEVRSGGIEFSATWSPDKRARMKIRQPRSSNEDLSVELNLPGRPRMLWLANGFLTHLGNTLEDYPSLVPEALMAHAKVWEYVQSNLHGHVSLS